MDFAPLAVALALVWKVVDFAKLVRVRNIDGVVTQAVTWAAGVLVIFLLAGTDFASGIKIGSIPLSHLDWQALVLLGLSVSSTGSVAYDFKRAFDRNDSAAMPSLVTGLVPVVPPPVVDSDTPAAATHAAPAAKAVAKAAAKKASPRRRADAGSARFSTVLAVLSSLLIGEGVLSVAMGASRALGVVAALWGATLLFYARSRSADRLVQDDGGYASYGHLGWVLVVVGLLLWLLLGATVLGIILVIVGAILLLAGGVG